MNTPEPAGSGNEESSAGVDMRSLWTLLDPGTRQWLMDHTGTAVVPRAVTAAICRESKQTVPQDAHGQARLNDEDMQFIRTRAHSAFAEHGTELLYEAVQPKTGQERHQRSHCVPVRERIRTVVPLHRVRGGRGRS